MPGFSTEAILLRKIEYGDHDFIISFLTRSNGKISVIAKNAKKSVRRFSGALDLFSVNQIQCTLPQKKKDALVILAQADLENAYANIRSDVLKTGYASYWAELVHAWLEEGKKQSALYDLLSFSLEMLDKGIMEKSVINLLFLIHFMGISGFSPSLQTCEHCQCDLDQMDQGRIWFDFQKGHLVCTRCAANRTKQGMMVSKGTLKQLFWIQDTQMNRTDRIRFSKASIKEGEYLLESFIAFHIGRQFNSLKFLHQLRIDT